MKYNKPIHPNLFVIHLISEENLLFATYLVLPPPIQGVFKVIMFQGGQSLKQSCIAPPIQGVFKGTMFQGGQSLKQGGHTSDSTAVVDPPI